MVDLLREIRYASRRLLADRFTSAVAVLSLALGLGTYVFAARLLDGLFWSTPPGLSEPERLRRVYGSSPADGAPQWDDAFSYPDYEAFSRAPSSLSAGVAAWTTTSVSVGQGPEAVRANVAVVSPSYFPVLGITPSRGVFSQGEGTADSVFMSQAFWKSHFGSREDILGTVVSLDGRPFTVRALLPAGFRGLGSRPHDLWLPDQAFDWLSGSEARTDGHRKFLSLVMRLAQDAEVGAAQEAFTAVARLRGQEVPGFWSKEPAALLSPLPPGNAPGTPPEARVARGIAALSLALLLAAIINAAHWLVVRTLDRERDLAVRSALGASPRRLWLGPWIELVLATAIGLAAGMAVQFLVEPAVARLLPLVATGGQDASGRALWTIVLGAVAILAACSVLPWRWSRRPSLLVALQGTRAGGSEVTKRFRWIVPVVQVTVATLLVALAGTFYASLNRAKSERLGLAVDSVLIATADFDRVGLSPERGSELLRLAESRLRAIGGVAGTALCASVPFESVFGIPFSIPGEEPLPRLAGGGPYWNAVSPGYFRTLGLELRAGRFFEEADRADSAPVVIINETLARLGFREASPLGRCLVLGKPGGPCATVVGVVTDSRRFSLREDPAFQAYVPLGQPADLVGPQALLVRAAGPPEEQLGTIRREVQASHPEMPAVGVRLLRDIVDPEYRPWRLGVAVFGAMGWVALVLAFAGLYAVTARGVLERKREGAIRLALGASPERLTRRFVGRGLRVASLGAGLGLALAFVLVRAWGPDIVDDLRTEPLALVGAALASCAAAALAAYVPARRFGRVDPSEVLREG
jgi:putative ABC transport system permease protein